MSANRNATVPFDSQEDGFLLTNIVIVTPDEQEGDLHLAHLTWQFLEKNSAGETLQVLKELHLAICVSHNLVQTAEAEQQNFCSYVQTLPPHEQPSPHTLVTVFVYLFKDLAICLLSLKAKQRQVDVDMDL